MVVGGIATGLYFTFRPTRISPNWELASVVRQRAMGAQYLPDAEKLVATEVVAEGDGITPLGQNVGMTIEEYNRLIGDIGSLWHPYQGTFHIHDVRDIVIYMTENVGVFDSWFRYRGTNRQGNPEDFAHIPRSLADGEFFMTIDEETDKITIVQRMGFQPWVWNRQAGHGIMNPDRPTGYPGGTGVSGYRANWPIMAHSVMVINYFYNEQGIEVVEAEIVEFFNVYNTVHIVGHQFLRNIRDKSFTRYEIITAPYVVDTDGANDPNFDPDGSLHIVPWGKDIDGIRLTGHSRRFTHIDYSDADNVSILLVQQEMSARYNGIVDTGLVQYLRLREGDLSVFTTHFGFGSQPEVVGRGTFGQDILGHRISALSFTGHEVTLDDPDYQTRSTEQVDFVQRPHSTAINYVTYAFESMMNALSISNETISSLDGSPTTVGVLEQNIWEVLELIASELVENSFLGNNYQKGLRIRYSNGPDITYRLHTPPDWYNQD